MCIEFLGWYMAFSLVSYKLNLFIKFLFEIPELKMDCFGWSADAPAICLLHDISVFSIELPKLKDGEKNIIYFCQILVIFEE